MTLNNRIKIAFIVLGFFLVLNSGVAIYANKKTFAAINSFTYKDLPSVVENSKMNGIAKDMRALIYRLHLKSSNEQIVPKIEERFSELLDQYRSSKMEYLAVPFANENERIKFTAVNASFDDWVLVSKKLINLKKVDFNSPDFDNILSSDYREVANKYLSAMTEFIDDLSAQSKRKIVFLEETNKTNNLILIISSAVGLIVSFIGGMLISKSTGKILENLYTTFSEKFILLSDNCSKGEELSMKNLNRVDSQSTALNQTSAATQETLKSLEGVASQAKNLNDKTKINIEVLDESSRSLNLLDQSIKSVDEINNQLSNQLAQNNIDLKEILEIFREIENKTNMINEIVFQTKLLSFNASVEAARAGEHGKGFSVVANEINELASKSGKSSNEIFSLLQVSQKSISGLIDNSTAETKKIVNQFNSSVETSMSLSLESKDKISLAIQSINDSFYYVNEISSSTEQQVAAISQISNAMLSLQTINGENESGASESASLLMDIKKSAIDIDSSIRNLVYGTNSTTGG